MFLKVGIDQRQLQYLISTEVDRNTPWLQVDSYGPPAETHAKWGKNSYPV